MNPTPWLSRRSPVVSIKAAKRPYEPLLPRPSGQILDVEQRSRAQRSFGQFAKQRSAKLMGFQKTRPWRRSPYRATETPVWHGRKAFGGHFWVGSVPFGKIGRSVRPKAGRLAAFRRLLTRLARACSMMAPVRVARPIDRRRTGLETHLVPMLSKAQSHPILDVRYTALTLHLARSRSARDLGSFQAPQPNLTHTAAPKGRLFLLDGQNPKGLP